jgi:alpha-beta hydrolase superfamily lysophospholipase
MSDENWCQEKNELHQQCVVINPLLNVFRKNPRATDMHLEYFHTSDNYPLFYRYWRLSHNIEPEKIIICIHGLHSHGEKFVILADEFVQKNWETYAVDLRGHGLSWIDPKNKGDIPEYSVWVRDLEEFMDYIQAKHPNIPIYIIAESMGAAIAIHIAHSHPLQLKGLILISPALKPWKEIQFSMILEAFTYAAAKTSEENVIPHNKERKFSTNSDEYIQYLLNDPLRITSVSPRYYYQVLKMVHHLKKYTDFDQFYPTCMFFGGRDNLINFDGLIRFTYLLGRNKKALHYIPQAFHDLITDEEAIKYQLYEKIVEWISCASDSHNSKI